MKKPPCKVDGVECGKRYVGCHSTCESYHEWLAIHAKEKEARYLYYAKSNDAEAHLKDTKSKVGKRCQSKRRVGQV